MACPYCKTSSASPQPPKSGFGFVKFVLDNIEETAEAQEFLNEILDLRRNTRPGYSPRVMLRAYCLKYLLSIEYNLVLLQRLRNSSKLRRLCGFTGSIPSESTFSRFFRKLADRYSLIEGAIQSIVEHLRVHLPDMGREIAIDSTDIESFANPRRNPVVDGDAGWGIRTTKHKSTNAKSGKEKEYFFGYKMHALSDVVYGTPLSYRLRPANVNDTTELQPVYEKARKQYPWMKPEYLIADRGYDAAKHHKYLHSLGIKPIIHIRQTTGPRRKDKLHHTIYSTMGAPTCMGGMEMEYLNTDPQTGKHLYQCPPGGCIRKLQGRLFPQCNDSHWEDPNDDIRVIGIVARASQEWEEKYKKRTVIERGFSSMKRSRLLNKHMYTEQSKIRAHVALATLTYAATMLGHMLAKDPDSIRRMRLRV